MKKLKFYLILLIITIISSDVSKASDNAKQELNNLYQITHPDFPDHKCYFLGTRHINSDVSDDIIDFINAHCQNVYFENDQDSTGSTSKSTNEVDQIYERYQLNKNNLKQFSSFPASRELLEGFNSCKFSIDLIQICQGRPDIIKSLQQKSHSDQTVDEFWNEMDINDQVVVALALGRLQFPEDYIAENYLMKNYIEPIDLITETIISSAWKSMNDFMFNNFLGEISLPGTEDILKEKLKNVSFYSLETFSDVKQGLRDLVKEYTPPTDPYTNWVRVFEETKDIFNAQTLQEALEKSGKTESSSTSSYNEIISNNIPDPLRKVLVDTLFSKRENRWILQIKDIFANKIGDNKATLFAVGSLHIPNLIKKFNQEGYNSKRII